MRNEANFFILKDVLEKIVLNLNSPVLNTMRLLDIGQKIFAFTILPNRLANKIR